MKNLDTLIAEFQIQLEVASLKIDQNYTGQVENNCTPNWDKIYSQVGLIEIYSKAIKEQILNTKLEYID